MPRSLLLKVVFTGVRLQAEVMVMQFARSLRWPRQVQERGLLEKIRRNESSAFGREHGFKDIRTVQDFRRAMPVRDYTYFEPYVERVKEGDLGAMFGPDEGLIMFALTSGTTGKPKYIPITRSFLKHYDRSSLLWGAYTYFGHETMLEGKILPIVSSTCEERTARGVPCGAASGLHAKSQRYLGRALYAVPGPIFDIHSTDAKYYAVMRFGAAEDITIVSTPNPSTLIEVAKTADAHKEAIMRDIRDGTLSPKFDIPESIRLESAARLRPNPDRARELEEIVRRTGCLLPKDLWPHLVVIGCWKGGPLRSYLPMFPQYYGDAPVRDLGLIASEGRMSIPIADEGSRGVLDIEGAFFEFIPEDQEDRKDPETLLCTEVEEGKRYFIVLTTASGLYRYNIYDLVEVKGFLHQTPIIEFLNKGRHMSSLTGEKIHESQVVDAVNAAAAAAGLTVEAFTLCPSWDGDAHYLLLVEESRLGRPEAQYPLIRGVDERLRKINLEYDKKRESRRLGPMVLTVVADGSFDQLRREIIEQRGRAEQYKHAYLVPEHKFVQRFTVIRTVAPSATA